MKQYRIYIVGKVKDLPYQTAFNSFLQVEEMLKKLGQEVVNPMRLLTPGIDWHHALKQRLSHMLGCNAIFLMRDWEHSNVARLEYHNANMLDYTLINTQVIEDFIIQREKRDQLLNPED